MILSTPNDAPPNFCAIRIEAANLVQSVYKGEVHPMRRRVIRELMVLEPTDEYGIGYMYVHIASFPGLLRAHALHM